MRLLPTVALALLVQLAAAQAQSPAQSPAQTSVQPAVQPPVQPQPMPEAQNDVRVQINVNFFISGTADDSEESRQAQENARRSLYERAGRECDLMKVTLASECRLQSVNVSINRQSNRAPEGFVASGNFVFRIKPK